LLAREKIGVYEEIVQKMAGGPCGLGPVTLRREVKEWMEFVDVKVMLRSFYHLWFL
jgi:hypothetical protein